MKKIDELTLDELKDLGFKPFQQSLAKVYFPERPKGYVIAFRNVCCYAANKATHLLHPNANVPTFPKNDDSGFTRGNYKDIAEGIFQRLPDYAKKVIR